MPHEDLSELFAEYVEDYVPEEKKEKLPDPAEYVAIETAKAEKEEADSEFEAWQKKSKEKRDEAYRMIKTESEKVFKKRTELIDYLLTQAHFDRYTVNNCLLIAAQHPGATRLKSFDEWKDEGKHILKGAKAITLLEPGDEYTRRDGTVGRYYNTRSLFDISQVKGGKLEKSATEQSESDKLRLLFQTMKAYDLKVCSYGEDGGRAAFFHVNKGTVYINKSVDFAFLYPQLCVELAHAVVANMNKIEYTRQQYGSMCEMIGYILCVRTNVSVPENAIPLRISHAYEELSQKDVIAVLEDIRKIANTISLTIEELKKSAK